jgi:hypothetical protein
MSNKYLLAVAVVIGLVMVGVLLFGLVAAPVMSQGPWGGRDHDMGRGGPGARGGYGQAYSGTVPYGYHDCDGPEECGAGGYGYGPGMGDRGMHGAGGYGKPYSDTVPYGYGPGMGGRGDRGMRGERGAVDPNAEPLTIEQATEAVKSYLASTGNDDLQLAEVMEFSGNFYAEVHEKSTGVGAFELLVDRYTGSVRPEPGPNMMWNSKYGHMGGGRWDAPTGEMTVTPQQAVKLAQEYLDQAAPGLKAGEAEPFYGYYTLHTERDGKIAGMLSVNGYSGEVWYHNWHGDFIGMSEDES